MTGYTFTSHPRSNFDQLKQWAKEYKVAAVCGHSFYQDAADGEEIFTHNLTDVPEHFILNGDTRFADGYNMQYWLLDGNAALLGRLGSSPKGRTLGQFMSEFLKVRHKSSMRAVHVLRTPTEYQFEVYTGDFGDLAQSIRDFRP